MAKLGAAVAVSCLLLTGCAGGDGNDAGAGGGETGEEPFEFLFIGGTTGPAASTVANVLLGMQAAIDEVNADGGIGGRQIEVTVLDSKSDPTQAVTQLQSVLSSGDIPDIVYPGVTSAESLALLPLLTEEGIWSMAQTASPVINDPEAYPYHFGVSVSKITELNMALAGPMEELDPKRVGLFTANDAIGDASVAGVEPVVEDIGAELAVERFDPTAVDYTVQFQRLLAANPDLIIADFTGGDPTPRMFQALETAGGLGIPLWIGPGVMGNVSPTTVASPEQLANCSMPATYAFSIGSDTVRENIQPLADAIAESGETRNIYVPGLGFDLIRMMAFAANEADGDFGGENMAEIMVGLELPEDYSIMYGDDPGYSAESHFPHPNDATYGVAACDSVIDENGFWVVNE